MSSAKRAATRSLGLVLLALVILPASSRAQDEDGPRKRPDPHRIINESMHFLKDREPDVTAEEEALYKNALEQFAVHPDLSVKLLEGIVADTKGPKPPSPAFDFLLGNFYYASGALAKAEDSYLKAVDQYPSFLRAWTNLGLLYHGEGRYEKAIPCFQKAVTLGGRESTTFGGMGECLEKTGDAIGAEVAYVQALAVDPGNVAWMEGLLRVYIAAKQYPRAEVMVRSLIHGRPREVRHWLTYANIMVATGRKLEAIALLEQTIATGMAGDQEIAELAGLYADQQLVPEALRNYGMIQVTAQALGETKTFQLVRMLIARAEWGRAQALLDQIGPTLAGPGRREFLQVQADLLSARKNWPAAQSTLDELLRLDPMNGRALVSLGRIYVAQGDGAHATVVLEMAERTSEGARPASIELANLELKNRHYEESISYLEKALTLEKNPDLEAILARLRELLPDAGHGAT